MNHSFCNNLIQTSLEDVKRMRVYLGKYGGLEAMMQEDVGAGAITSILNDSLGNTTVRVHYTPFDCTDCNDTANFCSGENPFNQKFIDFDFNISRKICAIDLDIDQYNSICGGTNKGAEEFIIQKIYSKLPKALEGINQSILAYLHSNAGQWASGATSKTYSFTNPTTGNLQANELIRLQWDLTELGITMPVAIAGYAAMAYNQAFITTKSPNYNGVDATQLSPIKFYTDTTIDKLFPATTNNILFFDPQRVLFLRWYKHSKRIHNMSRPLSKEDFRNIMKFDSADRVFGVLEVPTAVDSNGNLTNRLPMELEIRKIVTEDSDGCQKPIYRLLITFNGGIMVLPNEQCLTTGNTGVFLAQSCAPAEATPCEPVVPPVIPTITKCFNFVGCDLFPSSSISVNGATQAVTSSTISNENDLVALLNTVYPSSFSVVGAGIIQANFAVSQLSYCNAVDSHIYELEEVTCP